MFWIWKKQAVLPADLVLPAASEWPDGWQPLEPRDARPLAEELYREICRQHVLFGKRVAAIARRKQRDDVLFYVDTPDIPLAEVHLTWSRESDPAWPFTETFETLENWLGSLGDDLAET